MKPSIVLLLGIGCLLALASEVSADCCRASLTITYTVDGGQACGSVGGHGKSDSCTITICADGRAQVGTFCGRGSCNIFGCACKNGCLTGDYLNSFINNNKGHNIKVLGQRWNT
ncbi:protein Diedel-like [Drosophila guanche]|uniref:protein Diedel-like n=1 Tax=Drosophila guanche TaxID=7266 RepID=UPI00147092A2|nr:protein Diedel-like [Drosophila guanche]